MSAGWMGARTVVGATVVILVGASCASRPAGARGGAPSLQPSTAPSSVGQSANSATSPSGAPTSAPPKLFATITGLPQNATLAVGGSWLQFTGTIANGTGSTATEIAPVLSLGHCTCSDPDLGMAPLAQMQALDPATGAWHDIPFDREGGGMDYIGAVQVPATDLAPGETRSVTYRLRINAQQSYPIRNGAGTIDVSIVTHPGQSAKLVGDMATAHVQYTIG